MKLIIQFPPSVNTYWRAPNKGPLAGRHMISSKGRSYLLETQIQIRKQYPRWIQPFEGPLSISLVFHPPTNVKRDLDNFFKAPFDAMTKLGVWLDDSQVKKIIAEWGPKVKGGSIELTISAYDEGATV